MLDIRNMKKTKCFIRTKLFKQEVEYLAAAEPLGFWL